MFCCCDFFLIYFFFSLAHRSLIARWSITKLWQTAGSGCHFRTLIDVGTYPHSPRICGSKKHIFAVLATLWRPCGHKRQCFTVAVKNIENIKHRQGICSRSFKVIDLCCNWKRIYDFLLVINCHLSSISHRFAKQIKNHPTPVWAPDRGDSLRISSSNVVG